MLRSRSIKRRRWFWPEPFIPFPMTLSHVKMVEWKGRAVLSRKLRPFHRPGSSLILIVSRLSGFGSLNHWTQRRDDREMDELRAHVKMRNNRCLMRSKMLPEYRGCEEWLLKGFCRRKKWQFDRERHCHKAISRPRVQYTMHRAHHYVRLQQNSHWNFIFSDREPKFPKWHVCKVSQSSTELHPRFHFLKEYYFENAITVK